MEALKATFLLSIDLHFVKSCHGQDQQNDKVALLEEKADSSYYENVKHCQRLLSPNQLLLEQNNQAFKLNCLFVQSWDFLKT